MRAVARLLLVLIIACHGVPTLSLAAPAACAHCQSGGPCESGHCPRHDGSGHVHGKKSGHDGGHDHCKSRRGRCELHASSCAGSAGAVSLPTADPKVPTAESIVSLAYMTWALRGPAPSLFDSLRLAPPDPPPLSTDLS